MQTGLGAGGVSPAALAAGLADPTAQAALRLNASLPTRTAMRAITPTAGGLYWLGEANREGFLRYDASDTTTADDGAMVIVTGGGARLKRVHDGEVNARWFGVYPDNRDNCAALMAAITYVKQQNGESNTGGTLFIPKGYYKLFFEDGSSGLTTFLIDVNNVTIRGEGRGTILSLRRPVAMAATGPLQAVFTFRQTGVRGDGGGIRDIAIDGHSQCYWAAQVDSWRFFQASHIEGLDLYGGVLDFYNQQTIGGEAVKVDHVNYIPFTGGGTACFAKYCVRFRSASTAQPWVESVISNVLGIGVWFTALMLDGCLRMTALQVAGAGSSTSSNIFDPDTGTNPGSKSTCNHAVVITNNTSGSNGAETGWNTIEAAYLEADGGTETTSTCATVWIDTPAGQTGINRNNVIRSVAMSNGAGPALIWVTNNSGIAGKTLANVIEWNRKAIDGDLVHIGVDVVDTTLRLMPSQGQIFKIQDLGTGTRVNGVLSYAFESAGLFPLMTPGTARVDVGDIAVDDTTGRIVLIDKRGLPALLRGRPGTDFLASQGNQKITAIATPSAPAVKNTGAAGATTATYYVVGKDKDGNKSIPSAVGSTTTGNASLSSTDYNHVTWRPLDWATSYDLLKGDTSHSIATGLVLPYYDDVGGGTSAYTPAGTNPQPRFTVDGHFYCSQQVIPSAPTALAAAGTGATTARSATDQFGTVTLVAGTGGTTGDLMTCNFALTWSGVTLGVVIAPANAAAAALQGYVDPANITTSTWKLSAGVAPTNGVTYKWSFWVSG